MKCPYCKGANIDFVDEDKDSTKYICRNCNEDFIVHNDGHLTTRNGFPIYKVVKNKEIPMKLEDIE